VPHFCTAAEKPHQNTEYSTTRLMCEVNSNTYFEIDTIAERSTHCAI
jgi:hypothetical protein